MYKIKYLSTGHIFELPDITAEDLKLKFPAEYKIIEKNGKKFRDNVPLKQNVGNSSIYSKVVEGGKENKRKKGGLND